MKRARILGTGSYLPERVVDNFELASLMTTSDEWIQQRSGIKTRRYAAPTDTPATMGAEAARRALDAAGLAPSDIDFLICTTQTPEFHFPGTGCIIQEKLGMSGIGALDVRNQCTGFLYGLSIADAYLRLGTYKRILLVSTELHSRGLEYTDEGRHVTVLFGDGAGAVVVGESDDPERGIMTVKLHADGRFAHDLIVESPGFWGPDPWCNPQVFEEGRHFPKMNGKAVFKEAVSSMRQVVHDVLAEQGLSAAQVDHFIPHQANRRINEAVAQGAGIAPEKCDFSIERYGNCASASVPVALDEFVRGGRIHDRDLVLFATFAAGFTWGGAVIRW